MKAIKRYLKSPVASDLTEAMVFIGGPRQVGKTTFAVEFLPSKSKKDPGYFNWDIAQQRVAIRKNLIPQQISLIILDEIHKYSRWRNLVKGLFDQNFPEQKYIVTGSARLDVYRRGGESLHGRYHYYRLHPLSLCELNSHPTTSDLDQLLNYGGFPQPLLKASSKFLRRWQRERMDRIIGEDIRDLERVREVSLIELLVDALPERVGSPLSIQSLSEDLEVAHDTVKRWLQILENMYVCFQISPYGSPRIRAVKKERKLYFWDWTQITDPGHKFENLVACQLLKYCHYLEDTEGYRMELRYLRDTDKREVDFVVIKDKQPIFAVECKSNEKAPNPHTHYFRERTRIPKFFQVHMQKADYGNETKGTRVLPFITFCTELQMP